MKGSRVVSEHINSEGERITVETCLEGDFAGQQILVIYDDPIDLGGSGIGAPMLFDASTRLWIASQIEQAES